MNAHAHVHAHVLALDRALARDRCVLHSPFACACAARAVARDSRVLGTDPFERHGSQESLSRLLNASFRCASGISSASESYGLFCSITESIKENDTRIQQRDGMSETGLWCK